MPNKYAHSLSLGGVNSGKTIVSIVNNRKCYLKLQAQRLRLHVCTANAVSCQCCMGK